MTKYHTNGTIIGIICDYWDIELLDFKARRRNANLAKQRQIAVWCYRKLTPYSFTEIGKIFDRDQSTINHAVRKVDHWVDHNYKQGKEALELLNYLKNPSPGQLQLFESSSPFLDRRVGASEEIDNLL